MTLSRHSLVALANSTAPLAHLRRFLRMGTSQTSPGKPNSSGLDLEKTSRLRSRHNFFLDIPFDRTHWLVAGSEVAFVGLRDRGETIQASVGEPVVSRRAPPNRQLFKLLFGLRFRCKQIARIRMPPEINTRSPMLNSPSRAWSARNGSRVFDVAACHTVLAGF